MIFTAQKATQTSVGESALPRKRPALDRIKSVIRGFACGTQARRPAMKRLCDGGIPARYSPRKRIDELGNHAVTNSFKLNSFNIGAYHIIFCA